MMILLTPYSYKIFSILLIPHNFKNDLSKPNLNICLKRVDY